MCRRTLRAACRIALAGTLVLLIAPAPAGAQQGAAPPDRPWTPADVIPRVMQIRPEWPAPEAAPPVQPRVVRPALFDHWPPIREQAAPDGAWLVGTEEGHLYVRVAGRDAPDVLASATDAWRWDVAGARWAPGAEWIAVRRIHDAHVPRIPIVDWAADTVRSVPYTRAGEPLPTHRLWVVHRPSGTTQAIPHTPGTTYVHAVGWSPDGTTLRYLEADRLVKRLDVMEFDVASGTTRRLLRETSATNVLGLEMLHGYGQALDRRGLIHFFEDRGVFVWASERSGQRQLYLYDVDGTLRRSLTEDVLAGPVDRVVATDDETGSVFFVAQGDPGTPHRHQLYRVGLDGGTVHRISAGPVIKSVRQVPDADALWVYRAGLPDTLQVDRVSFDGDVIETVWQADWTFLNPIERSARRVTLPAADGKTALDALLIVPPDLDPAQQYPLIEYIYAGPHQRFVPRDPQTPWLWEGYFLAAQGYVVVMIDGRGTPGRGKAFQDAGHGRIGQFEIADHRAALEHLVADHAFIDPERIGVLGHSWGGYFALRALIQAPDRYRTAVLAAPAVDLIDFRVAVEPYMGCLPADCPAAYAAGANTPAVDRIEGPLLIVHGTADDDVPFGASMKLVSALEAAQAPHTLRVLPGRNHIVQRSPHFWRHTMRFLATHLKDREPQGKR